MTQSWRCTCRVFLGVGCRSDRCKHILQRAPSSYSRSPRIVNNPRALIIGTPIRYELDGVRDDLLTAGLGPEGLRGPVPEFADSVRPTALELRRRAIYMNYRGLVDITAGGGVGTLFGPSGSTLIAGVEYLFAMRTPDGAALTSALLQIPKTFDRQNPCLVAVASSGSRGIYGALPTA